VLPRGEAPASALNSGRGTLVLRKIHGERGTPVARILLSKRRRISSASRSPAQRLANAASASSDSAIDRRLGEADTHAVGNNAPEDSVGGGVWRNRLGFVGAALLGAAVVGVCWVLFSGGDTGSVASFQVSAGNPPVVFLYLDNVHIASYLAQLQGGAATTEVLSREATATRNASVASNGVGVGGSTSQQSTAQLSLTVNDQSRFTDLVDLLQTDGFLHTIDMAAHAAVIRRDFAAVPDGAFVKLSNCSLTLPSYVQDEQLWRAAKGRLSVTDLATGNGRANFLQTAYNQALTDQAQAKGKKGLGVVGAAESHVAFKKGEGPAQARHEMNHLVRRAGANPTVPLSSCSPFGADVYAPDLLMPIRLGEFTANPAALAGRVTLVAKVMLAVHGTDDYIDLAALQQWAGASFWTHGQLQDDAVVLGPGYVLQPIAIYK
jgi:hypothetical protein